MKKSHMKTLMAKLMRWYPKGFPAGMSDIEFSARCDDYLEILGDYDYKLVNEAVNELVKTNTFLPSVSEILEQVKALEQKNVTAAVPDEFTDEDGYRYKRQNGQMVCVYRPNRTPLKDPALQAFMDEKRRIYAEVGAPHSYTMRQVRELAKQKHIEIPVQDDMKEFMEILGRK